MFSSFDEKLLECSHNEDPIFVPTEAVLQGFYKQIFLNRSLMFSSFNEKLLECSHNEDPIFVPTEAVL